MRRLKLCLSACLLGLAAPAFAAAPHYKITLLQSLGGETVANGVNSQGQVVGYSYDGDGGQHGTLWQNGTVQSLTPGNYGYLNAINEQGVSAGLSQDYISDQSWLEAATTYSAGVPTLYHLGVQSYLDQFAAINDAGQAAGSTKVFEGDLGYLQHATALFGSDLVDLGTLGDQGSSSGASGINNAGLVVGYSEYQHGSDLAHAFSYDANGLHDLGTMAGAYSAAYGVNDSGVIVGQSTYTSGGDATHAFALKDGVWTDLGALDGEGISATAWAINSTGTIVGTSQVDPADPYMLHATLWQDGQIYDLNNLIGPNSGWVLNSANAISSNGLIVGYGVFGGQVQAFMLQAAPAPETARWALMLLGFGAVGYTLRSRRTLAAG